MKSLTICDETTLIHLTKPLARQGLYLLLFNTVKSSKSANYSSRLMPLLYLHHLRLDDLLYTSLKKPLTFTNKDLACIIVQYKILFNYSSLYRIHN